MNAPPLFSDQPSLPVTDDDSGRFRRMFIFEAGWRVGVKTGSMRELCYMMAPGQDYYHRLLDGEIFLERDRERLCLPCAWRRGLISLEPRQLRDSIASVSVDDQAIPLELDWRDVKRSK